MRVGACPLNGRPSMSQAVRMKLFLVSAAAIERFSSVVNPVSARLLRIASTNADRSQHEKVQEQIVWP